MADILMTYGSLTDTATKVNTAKEDLDTVISALDSAVGALEGNWSGNSYDAFVQAWQEYKPAMQKLNEAVANFAPELNDTVTRWQETDSGVTY